MKTSCDSWLEHIYQVCDEKFSLNSILHFYLHQKKIKFSEGGAKKLAADFAFFRQWVDVAFLS